MNTKPNLQRWWTYTRMAWLLSGVCAALVLIASVSVLHLHQRGQRQRLNSESSELQLQFDQRLRAYEQVLRGGTGLFDASDHVSRGDWRKYVNKLQLANSFPGIQGVGYAEFFRPDERDEHINRIRAEGFPDYQIKPVGDRDRYSAIIYLEPFAERNLAAFGYDMLSEPLRQQAIDAAVRSGETTMTAKVTLMQETHGPVQPGFLMYVPVYHRGDPLDTAEQRLASARGVAYSPFRFHDLIDSMLRERRPAFEFLIFDGEQPNLDQLLYDSSRQGLEPLNSAPFKVTRTLYKYGRVWTIASYLPVAESQSPTLLLTILIGLGSGISVLVFFLVNSLTNRERQAVAIAAQMTERIIASERDLQAGNRQTQALLNHVADGILLADIDGNILRANPAAAQLFGCSVEALLRYRLEQLLPTASSVKWPTLLQDAMQHSELALLRELEACRADGQSVAVELSLAALPEQDPPSFVLVCRNINERRRVERLKREFVATVSHELRTPLTSISGSLSLVLSGQLGELSPAMRDVIAIASRNSHRLTDLINDLIDIEQISRGQMRFVFEPVPVAPLLQQVVEQMRGYAQQFDVTLNLEQGAATAVVQADRNRLQQVLTNLLSNGIKFSPVGASVTLRSDVLDDRLRLSISDHGAGVPEAFVPHLFQQFSRADSADNRRVGGTGLGLAISKEIIEKMQGRIGYLPVQPTGACFYIELPLTV